MICSILGRRGCGKSTLTKALLRSRSRVLIFDTLQEYSDVSNIRISTVDFLECLRVAEHGYFRIGLCASDEDTDESFALFCRAAWSVGDVLVVVDEIDGVTSAVSVPQEFAKLVRYGRHRNIEIITAARRAHDIPRILTSQTDYFCSFNQSEPNDKQYISKAVSVEYAEAVSRLPRYRYLFYGTFSGELNLTAIDSRNAPDIE